MGELYKKWGEKTSNWKILHKIWIPCFSWEKKRSEDLATQGSHIWMSTQLTLSPGCPIRLGYPPLVTYSSALWISPIYSTSLVLEAFSGVAKMILSLGSHCWYRTDVVNLWWASYGQQETNQVSSLLSLKKKAFIYLNK